MGSGGPQQGKWSSRRSCVSSRPPDVQGGGVEVGTGRLALLEAQKGPEHELGAVCYLEPGFYRSQDWGGIPILSVLPVNVGLRPLFKFHPLGNEPVFFASSADRAPSCK